MSKYWLIFMLTGVKIFSNTQWVPVEDIVVPVTVCVSVKCTRRTQT